MRLTLAYSRKLRGSKDRNSVLLTFPYPLFFFKCRVDESQDKDKLTLFRGQFTLSLDRARRGTFYKYVVVKKGNVHWEQLPEFLPRYGHDSVVNRSLKIPDNRIEPGGK